MISFCVDGLTGFRQVIEAASERNTSSVHHSSNTLKHRLQLQTHQGEATSRKVSVTREKSYEQTPICSRIRAKTYQVLR